MSFFSDAELGTLSIHKMILHVVGDSNDAFVALPELEIQQDAFFLDRIISATSSSVHTLLEDSQITPIIRSMGRDDVTFEQGGQELSRLFYRDHVKQSTKGAFFVFELRAGRPEARFYCLVKYDYREAVELANDVNGKSVLRSIIQAFVKDKKAVQKFCAIRFEDGDVVLNVTASDRMKESPDLTDYFEKYLGVFRSRSTEELTKKLNEVLRASANDLVNVLPDRNVGQAVGRAKAVLQGRDIITNDDIVDALFHAADRPDNEQTLAEIERVVRRKLKSLSLTDVDFKPEPNLLKSQPRQRIRTAERVSLEYPGDELGRSVTREELPGGGYQIIVTTTVPLVEDTPLAESRR